MNRLSRGPDRRHRLSRPSLHSLHQQAHGAKCSQWRNRPRRVEFLRVNSWLMQGKNNSKRAAKVGLSFILKRALMFFNNARRNWQAKAGSKIFRREKGIEQSFFSLWWN